MLDRSDLKKIAQARIEDGEVLLSSNRYDGAVYLCGYAVEIALKERICRTLGWPGYPSMRREFATTRVSELIIWACCLVFQEAKRKLRRNSSLSGRLWPNGILKCVINQSEVQINKRLN